MGVIYIQAEPPATTRRNGKSTAKKWELAAKAIPRSPAQVVEAKPIQQKVRWKPSTGPDRVPPKHLYGARKIGTGEQRSKLIEFINHTKKKVQS